MVNVADFTKRIDRILKFHDLSASAFADKIGVQRSSISHLLAGRNKPSLEFVMKVTAAFPEVDLYWLLHGEGHYPSKAKTAPTTQPQPEKKIKVDTPKPSPPQTKEIDKIVIFYSDGSFKSYSEKEY
ncbi:XRE family transcriptional regulator [Arenibacter aquaticus]|uniref:XRE family transcriptional regulator n=1 Tax=Arenibacter aquaticus TaxID=2489054 RepID=A0A3S0ABX0_9FLAO|nr:XRE family transcriptional regulator [Arenibacter aquaticus]